MAISKVVYGNTTLIDISEDTVNAGALLDGVSAHAPNGDAIVGTIAINSAADVSASGSIVSAPSGYYATGITKAVDAGALMINSSMVTANPAISLNSSTGVVTATVSNSTSIGATLTSGYISSYTSGIIYATGSNTLQLTTKAATTYTPSSATQTIASGQYLVGIQTVKGDANLIPENIAADVSIFGVIGTHQGGTSVDDMIIIGDYGLCFNNFSISSNTCISEAGTVSGNTLIAV